MTKEELEELNEKIWLEDLKEQVWLEQLDKKLDRYFDKEYIPLKLKDKPNYYEFDKADIYMFLEENKVKNWIERNDVFWIPKFEAHGLYLEYKRYYDLVKVIEEELGKRGWSLSN